MTRILSCAAALLLVPGAAEAAARVVLQDGDEAAVAVKTAWMAQFGDAVGVRFVGVAEVFPPAEPVMMLGDVNREVCAGEARSVLDFEAGSDAVIDLVAGMSYQEAGVAIGRVFEMLPCLTAAPSPEQLGHFQFMRGIVAFYFEGPAKATDRFEEALLVSPFLQWDTRYPPPVKPSFDEATMSAVQAESAFLSVSERVFTEGSLWLNGVGVDPRTRTHSLYAGTHLLQWKGAGAEATLNWVVHLDGGDSVALVEREDAVEMLLQGDAGPIVTEHVQAQVIAPVERNAGGVLYVAYEDDVVGFHSYDPIGSRWRPVDVLALERHVLGGERLQAVGIVMSVAGGFLLGGGLTVSGLRRDELADLRGEMFDPDGTGSLRKVEEHIGEYNSAREQANTGIGFSIVGGALLVGGVPLSIFGGHRAAGGGFRRQNGSQ